MQFYTLRFFLLDCLCLNLFMFERIQGQPFAKWVRDAPPSMALPRVYECKLSGVYILYAFGNMRRELLIGGDPRFAIPEGCRNRDDYA
jgi:hypothetical protein